MQHRFKFNMGVSIYFLYFLERNYNLDNIEALLDKKLELPNKKQAEVTFRKLLNHRC